MSKRSEKLRATFGVMSAAGQLSYEDLLEFSRAAGDEGDWEFALELLENALPLITPDNVRNRYPSAKTVRAEKLAEDHKRVYQNALLMKGWCLAQLGDSEQAYSIFSQIEKLSSYNYLGIAESAVNFFWSQALVLEGKYEVALHRLGLAALIAGREMDQELHAKVYSQVHGTMKGYEPFCESQRQRLAPELEDFKAETYEGETFTFSELDGKVVFLYFWFPACSGCLDKIPILNNLHRKFNDDGFEVVMLDAKADADGAARVIKETKPTFTMLKNNSSENELVEKVFRIRVFPSAFLVNRDRRIIHAYDWQHEYDAKILESRIRKLLKRWP